MTNTKRNYGLFLRFFFPCFLFVQFITAAAAAVVVVVVVVVMSVVLYYSWFGFHTMTTTVYTLLCFIFFLLNSVDGAEDVEVLSNGLAFISSVSRMFTHNATMFVPYNDIC